MATIRLRNARYQAIIKRRGRKAVTKTFVRRSDAEAWGRKTESELERGLYIDVSRAEKVTFSEVLDRYLSSGHHSKDIPSRAKLLRRHFGNRTLTMITSAELATYRDNRLKVVSRQSVIHELGLIKRVLKKCIVDWGIQLPKGIPLVEKPKLPRGRDRRLYDGEENRLIAALKSSPKVATVVKFALETAMRREELSNIDWCDVDLRKRTLHIPKTKTDVPRTIPLSTKAVSVLMAMPHQSTGNVFAVRPNTITNAFNRACKRAGIVDLRFHDLRHESASRFFELGLSVMEVSAITGHQDLRSLKRYTHLKAEDLVKKLG